MHTIIQNAQRVMNQKNIFNTNNDHQDMRLKLKGLKYSSEDIRHLTPMMANEIIQNQLINKNPSLNHGLNQ